MDELRIVHLALTEDECEMLLEAMYQQAHALRGESPSAERTRKGIAGKSLLQKLGTQLGICEQAGKAG
jgi:hypothetical protein